MQDRPTVDELLEAVATYLQNDVMPNTSGRISFHARVAANVLQMVRRELATEEEHLAEEWAGLNSLLGVEERPDGLPALRQRIHQRNTDLAERIQAGDADSGDYRRDVIAHLRRITHLRLLVSDPRLAEATKD
ncbi:MAG: DUF6285 domain-containing protein [Dehalococcoidia bacterium]|nr:DUF6285 domain-containing protein [Dehalococcoidia bacterium]